MGMTAKPALPRIEEVPLHAVNEVCTKEYRVPTVRRSIYSPNSDLSAEEDSHNASSVNADDDDDEEENLDVPPTARVIICCFFSDTIIL